MNVLQWEVGVSQKEPAFPSTVEKINQYKVVFF